MQGITPFLWFDNQAEEAANQYVALFPNSRITDVSRYGADGPGPEGTVMTVSFELDGRPFVAFNGGPHHKFTEAISLLVTREDQAEVDRLWAALSDGGEPGPCGWLKDRYGLSWQIVPTVLFQLLGDPDREKAGRATKAMLGMSKIEIKGLVDAFEGRA
ncbi:MAG: VOC family protein [Micromonosporaceae bacterium]|jgi:predicted 3-demethylubiquinone-9 3-methyltransferase (glyoxalase superfamily)|nr:VOC family protein [Micromonosporaceae bacterium]